MIILFGCVTLAFLFGCLFALNDGAALVECPLWGLFFGLFGVILGFVVGMIVGLVVYNGAHRVETQRTPLVAINDATRIQGQFTGAFFVSSGFIDQQPAFLWYEQDGPNSYVRKSADANESVIHYIPKGEHPYFTVTEKRPDAGGFFRTVALDARDTHEYPDSTRYDFYVPSGSIVQSYKLNNR